MQEFQTFVYLDLQKTGSTFISNLLQRHCNEREIRFSKHSRVGKEYDDNKFYFISVRDPLSQYLSLYSYGCAGSGGLYQRIRQAGLEELYDSTWPGFRRWLNFVLRPRNAPLLDRRYAEENVHTLLGYQSYRYLKLALRGRFANVAECKTRDELRQVYRKYRIVDFIVRTEHMKVDLSVLLTSHLRHAINDLPVALRHISEGDRLRASHRVDALYEGKSLGDEQLARLREREWLLHDLFGY